MSPAGVRLAIRTSLAAIFVVAMVVAFVVGRPVVGFIALVFLAVSIALLMVFLRERSAVKP